MNRRTKWIRALMIAAGVLEIAMGLAHFGMPRALQSSFAFGALPPVELGFVVLCVFALGILLVGFGCVTLLMATRRRVADSLLLGYCAIKALLFSGRVWLEVLIPVQVPLWGIHRPSDLVLPLLAAGCAIFVALTALVAGRQKTVRRFWHRYLDRSPPNQPGQASSRLRSS